MLFTGQTAPKAYRPYGVRPRQLATLTLVAGLAIFSRSAIGPIQEAMRIQLGMTDDQIALVQGPALAIPALMIGIPVGLLVDRWTRVRLLTLLSVLALAGSALTATAHGMRTLCLARALVGISSYSIPVASISLLSDLYDPSHLGRANMALAIGEIAGMALAFASGGLLLQSFRSWRSAMWWLSVPLAIGPAAALTLKEPPRTGVALQHPTAATSLFELWRHRTLLIPLVCGISLVGIADGAALIWVAPTLTRQLHVSSASVGSMVAAAILFSGVLGPVFGGMVADFCALRGGGSRTLISLSGLSFASAAFSWFGLAHTTVAFIVPLFGFLTAGGALNVAVMALLSASLPNELRGLAVSVCVISGLIFGLGFAPPAVSVISDAIGGAATIGRALALVCGTTSAIGTVIFLLAASAVARRSPSPRACG